MGPHMAWGNTSRHDRGYGSEWTKLREEVLRRDKYLCQQCLRDGHVTPLCVRPYDHAVDHIKGKANGGTDDLDNLQSLCSGCHDNKTQAEAIDGRGAEAKPKTQYDAKGWPIWGR
jgi:5-methylcytosine-specific restriction enzyme A